MTKRYVVSFEDLRDLINSSFAFFADKARECMRDDRVPMFSDRIKWIDEFLEINLKELPVDSLLDEVEEKFSSYFGKSFDQIKQDLMEKKQSVEDCAKNQEEVRKFFEKKKLT